MNTCDTCKWWGEKSGDEPIYRRCEHPKCDSGVFADGFGSVDGEPYNGGVIATGPQFGCVHHELK